MKLHDTTMSYTAQTSATNASRASGNAADETEPQRREKPEHRTRNYPPKATGSENHIPPHEI